MYALKPDCGYTSIDELSRKLFSQYRQDLLLDNFLKNQNRTTDYYSSMSTTLESGERINIKNYSEYIDEIGLAEGDEAKKLRDEALNKLIQDFTTGNLTTSQANGLLSAIGVTDKELTETSNGMYKLSFKYDDITYTLHCNKSAAESSMDNVEQTTYTYQAILDIAGDMGINQDVLKTFFTETISTTIGVNGRDSNVRPETSYTLKEGKTIEAFKAANEAKNNNSTVGGKWQKFIESGSYEKLNKFLAGTETFELSETLDLYKEVTEMLNTEFTDTEADRNLRTTLEASKELLMKNMYQSITGKDWDGDTNTFVKDIMSNYQNPDVLTMMRDMDDVFYMSQSQKEELADFIENPDLINDRQGNIFFMKLFSLFERTLESPETASEEITTGSYTYSRLFMPYKEQYGIDEETFKELYTLAGDYALNSDTAPGTVENSQEFLRCLENAVILADSYEYYKSENPDIPTEIIEDFIKEGMYDLFNKVTLTTNLDSLIPTFDNFVNTSIINYVFSSTNEADETVMKRGFGDKAATIPDGVKEKYSYELPGKVKVEIDMSKALLDRGDKYYINTSMTITTNGQSYSIPVTGKIKPIINSNDGTIISDSGAIINEYFTYLVETIAYASPTVQSDIYNELDGIYIGECFNPHNRDQSMSDAYGAFDHYENVIQVNPYNISSSYKLQMVDEQSAFKATFLHELGHSLDWHYDPLGNLVPHTFNTDWSYLSGEEYLDAFLSFQKSIQENKKFENKDYPVSSFSEFWAEYYAYVNTDGNCLYSDVIREFIKQANKDDKLKKLKEALDNSFAKVRQDKQYNTFDETNQIGTNGRKQYNDDITASSPSKPNISSNPNNTMSALQKPNFSDRALASLNSFTQSVTSSGGWSYNLDGDNSTASMPGLNISASMPWYTEEYYRQLADAGMSYEEGQRFTQSLRELVEDPSDVTTIIQLVAIGKYKITMEETYAGSNEYIAGISPVTDGDIIGKGSGYADQADANSSRDENGNLTGNYAGWDNLQEELANQYLRNPNDPNIKGKTAEELFQEVWGLNDTNSQGTVCTVANDADYINSSAPATPSKPSVSIKNKLYRYQPPGQVVVTLTYSTGVKKDVDITSQLLPRICWEGIRCDYSSDEINYLTPTILKEYVRQQNQKEGNLTLP